MGGWWGAGVKSCVLCSVCCAWRAWRWPECVLRAPLGGGGGWPGGQAVTAAASAPARSRHSLSWVWQAETAGVWALGAGGACREAACWAPDSRHQQLLQELLAWPETPLPWAAAGTGRSSVTGAAACARLARVPSHSSVRAALARDGTGARRAALPVTLRRVAHAVACLRSCHGHCQHPAVKFAHPGDAAYGVGDRPRQIGVSRAPSMMLPTL